MTISLHEGLVVLDGRVTDEKLAELLDLQNEQPELDFKRMLAPTTLEGLVELAKDVGAMQVAGGFIVGGVDDHGVPTGEMNGVDPRPFDEANLVPQLRKYLPEGLTVRSRVTTWKEHTVVVIFIAPHPHGYAVFHTDGKYTKPNGKEEIVFRAGEVFWRDGTRSVRIAQAGMEQIIARRIAAAKGEWIEEQQELRRREREELEAGHAGRELAKAPLGTLHFALSTQKLRVAVLEALRADDRQIVVQYLLNDAVGRTRAAIEAGALEDELAALLDKLAVVAAVFLEYEQPNFFARTIGVFSEIYSLPLGAQDDRNFSLNIAINPEALAPRVFLVVIERIYALGALAVRLRRWEAIRELTLQRPERIDEYWPNWLRHALTMGTRAQQLKRQDESGRVIEISLLSRAASVVEREPALHPDTSDTDAILTSLAQFDFLSNLAAIDGAETVDDKAFYTNWARFRQERIQPVADRLVGDAELRQAIFPNHGDGDLAVALLAVGKMAHTEGMRYDGFWGWDRTPVGEFIGRNRPAETSPRSPQSLRETSAR